MVRSSTPAADVVTLAILCPGQGGQHPQMLALLEGSRAAEDVFEQGSQALGTGIREWLTKPECIDSNSIAQPLLCLSELATWMALRDLLPEPLAFAGYSVGELASYACAGALGPGQLAKLAQTRAALMNAASAVPGGLIALRGMRRAEVNALCAAHMAWIAITIADDEFVVGGDALTLDTLADLAGACGAQIARLRVGVAAHTPLLTTAVRPFREALEGSALCTPRVTVIAGIDASLVTSRTQAITTLAAQVAAPIEWSRCMDSLYELGVRLFLELGPGCALARMVNEHLGDDVQARSVSEFRSLEGVAKWIELRSRGQ